MSDFVIQRLDQGSDAIPTSEIARVVNMIIDGYIKQGLLFPVLTSEPSDKYDGMHVVADGTSWDPGSGKGTYRYDGSAWNFLG